MAQERDDLVHLAKLAEQAERFDEMVERRRCTHIRRAAAYGGAGAAPRYLATAPRKFGPAESRERETRTDVNFRGRRRDARGSMKAAPRERDRAASANARRTQVEHMKVVARMPTELSVEERNLLSVAYKNYVKTRRDAWRTIQAI